jgi:hypothetical protein
VLESPQIGIIGVGEGSTPGCAGFDSVDIEEAEWMPSGCRPATRPTRTESRSRTGPPSRATRATSIRSRRCWGQFIHNVHARLANADVHAHPDRHFIAAELARTDKGPKPAHHFPFDV